MSTTEPRGGSEAPALFCDYLDFYRATIEAKARSLPQSALRQSLLPTGWTPLELVQHLVFMERRWFVWGFAGEEVADPWGDNLGADPAQGWNVGDDVTLDELVDRLHAGGRRTREIVTNADLADLAPPGPRFRGHDGQTASLAWICFHVLQEYARHAGHLDVAAELVDGSAGNL